jgi:hypothetical protein
LRPKPLTELDYDILSWDAINKDLFEPVDDISKSVHASVPSIAPLSILSSAQLDEAKLEARLELTKLRWTATDG